MNLISKNIFILSSIILVYTNNNSQSYPFFDGTDAQTKDIMYNAKKQIETVRKDNFTIQIQNLKDLKGKDIQIELVEHDFTFGTNLFGLYKIADWDLSKQMAVKTIDELFNTVIVCDYWGRTQSKKNKKPEWKYTDYQMELAEKFGKKNRYHALFFSYPRWLHHYETEEELWTIIEQRIKDVARRYGDKINEVDVINEFINYQYWDKNPHAKYLKTTKFPDFAKPENGARVLKLARKYLPKSKLVVLETNIWSVSNPIYQEIFEYHKKLIAMEVDYDYIGYQAHYYALQNRPFQEGTKEWGSRTFMMDEINRGMEQMAALGKPIIIAEFNPPSRSNKNNNPDQPRLSDDEIAAWEVNFYTLMFSKPYINGITRWFTIDNLGGRGMDAGVVSEQGVLKPNYFALKKLIKEKWHTKWKGKLGAEKIEFRGFCGKYKITAEGFKDETINLNKSNLFVSLSLRKN